jgi:DNA-binding MarR family transcriptional regulator
METESPWLSEEQQRVWRSWLALNAQLPAALHRQLQADSELSLPDFEVLVRLTESEDQVRVTDLARVMDWERSRLSHHVKRMESRGLVARRECADDARGAFVVVTDHGRAVIERAAPEHARTVRDLVFDGLSADELATLESVLTRVLGRLDPASGPSSYAGRGPAGGCP